MSKFLRGTLFGATIAAAYVLLNAPEPGHVTRAKLKGYIDQATKDIDDVRYKVDNLLVALDRLSKEGIQGSKEVVDDLQESLREFSEEAKPRVRRAKDKLDHLQEDVVEQANHLQSSIQEIKL